MIQPVLPSGITEQAVLSDLFFNSKRKNTWMVESYRDGSVLCQEENHRIIKIKILEAAKMKGKEAGERVKYCGY